MRESTSPKMVLMADVTNVRNDARLLREGKSLRAAGYRVIIVGYSRKNISFQKSEGPDGIVLWELPYRQPNVRSRVLYIVLIMVRDTLLFVEMYRRILFAQADIYHAHNIYSLPIMWLSARLRGRPLIYDSHELFCEWRKYGPYSGIRKWLLNRFIDLEHILFRRTDRVVCVSSGIQKILARIHKINKPVVIENFPSRSEILKEPAIGTLRKHLNLPLDRKIVIFSGGFYKAIRLDNLVRVACRFPDVSFVLMGFDSLGYKGHLERLSKEVGSGNVTFMDAVPSAEVVKYLSDANVAVHLYTARMLMVKYCSSNKIFQYLAAGLPIVCSKSFHSVRKATEGYNVCYWVDADSVLDLERGLRKTLSLSPDEAAEIRKRAQLCVKERCCWEVQEDRFLEVYRGLEGSFSAKSECQVGSCL